MRAIYYTETGGPDVLQLGERPEPSPRKGEVVVRVRVSGLNPSDTKSRAGWGGDPMPADLVIPNNDGAGVIDAVGEGVDPSRLGQRVWIYEATREGRNLGTCAERVAVPKHLAVPLPEAISFETGAALGVPAMTAHRATFGDGSLEGKTVLVTGGGGGVGHMAVQLARWGGARVLATASHSEDVELARKSGAEHVIDYKKEDVVARVMDITDGEGVHRIVDTSFAANLPVSAEVIRPMGTIATYFSAHDPDKGMRFPFWDLLMKNVRVQTTFVYGMDDAAHRAAVRDISAALNEGALSAHIGGRYPFTRDGVASAHADLDGGKLTGKAVISVSGG